MAQPEEVLENALLILRRVESETPPDASDILDALNSIKDLPVTKPLLAKTKAGILLTKIKSNENTEVADLSRAIVAQWKAAVSSKRPASSQDGSETPTQPQKMSKQDDDEASAQPAPTVSPDAVYTGVVTKDTKRNKCREFLFRAFIDGMQDDQRNLLELAQVNKIIAELEQALHEHYVSKNNSPREYNEQLRAIKSNLADKKNPELNARIYLGAVLVEALVTMTSADMASDAKKRERQKAKKDAMEACQSDWDLRNVKRAKGQFLCGKCKSDNTTYFQMQTRSSDEPMTT